MLDSLQPLWKENPLCSRGQQLAVQPTSVYLMAEQSLIVSVQLLEMSRDQPMYQICHCHHAGSSGYKLSFSDAGSGAHTFMVRAFVNNQLAGSSTASFTVPGKKLVHLFGMTTNSNCCFPSRTFNSKSNC